MTRSDAPYTQCSLVAPSAERPAPPACEAAGAHHGRHRRQRAAEL